MNLRSSIIPEAGVYKATIWLDGVLPAPISPVEQQKLDAFGPLVVTLGGTLESVDVDDLVIPASIVYIPRDLPLRHIFAVADSVDAPLYAALWITQTLEAIDTALVALLAKTVTSTSSAHTLPL